MDVFDLPALLDAIIIIIKCDCASKHEIIVEQFCRLTLVRLHF